MTAPTPQDTAEYITQSTQAVWTVPGLPTALALRPIKSIGVIGAGTMGGGIAMNFATAGLHVKIVETTQAALDRGLSVVRGHYQRSSDKGRFPQSEVEARMGRLEGCLTIADLAGCDLIIEAVFEEMELKRKIFTEIDRIAKPGAILATNTSALDIDAIAAMTTRPQDVIGLHFFSPANVMKLLEVVRADHTGDDIVATCMALAKTIDKTAVLVGVCPGFTGNRILFKRQNQALKLLHKGVMPWEVDAALNSFGFRMGPFQMADLAGLDLGWSKGASTKNPIRDALCELDRRGQKTKAGYYDYDASRTPLPSQVSAQVIQRVTGAAPISMAPQTIIETCIYPMINEALKILEENKVQRPSDIDVIWRDGYGWPADKGGPLWYGDQIGAAAILAKMHQLGDEDDAFSPAKLLETLAASGGHFVDIDTGGLKTGRPS